MSILILYVFIAVVVSFVCSILEAVLLSVSPAYIENLTTKNPPIGLMFRKLKADIGKPLIAILTLNTIAHTIGAAGAGAQAMLVFGNAYVGVFSAVLTLIILVFSEIIPKTIGAHYWRELVPFTAYTLKFITWFLHPFVKFAELLTKPFENKDSLSGLSREEFVAMAELSTKEGQLGEQESRILKSLMLLRGISVKDVMTPRVVMFSLSDTLLVEEYFHKYDKVYFSRIPVFHDEAENIIGYVFRNDLLLAQARGNGQKSLSNYVHSIATIVDTIRIKDVFKTLLEERSHIMLVVNEYGSVLGLITLEDVLETILGSEIVDEKDKTIDMQKEARRLWKKRAEEKGINIDS
jgi:CBS domain containing-hemolysin-like protein